MSYRNIARGGENSAVAHDTFEAWFGALSDLIDNPGPGLAIARAARMEVALRYTLVENSGIHLRAIKSAGAQIDDVDPGL